jgi:pimeloyl-ACP methyl ester carboxylesterase
LRVLLGANTPEELTRLFSQALGDVQTKVLGVRARAVLELDASVEMRECPVPLLVIQAENDRIVSRQSAQELRNLRPDADFVMIGGPHLILQCAPVQAVRAIRRFVEKL